jgi:hypothetical protein
MKRADRCCVCNRRPTSASEGRRIDGSWAEDKTIYRRFQGRWVCCFSCYRRLPRVASRAGRKADAR